MWLMLQRDEPGDLVIGTGVSHSVRDFVDLAFRHVALDPAEHVRSEPDQLRPTDIAELRADPSRARERIGWQARTSLEELVALMVDADLALLSG
jgi:GDPmannose 4,6-dehydratase